MHPRRTKASCGLELEQNFVRFAKSWPAPRPRESEVTMNAILALLRQLRGSPQVAIGAMVAASVVLLIGLWLITKSSYWFSVSWSGWTVLLSPAETTPKVLQPEPSQ
jgi:hypothetical protein